MSTDPHASLRQLIEKASSTVEKLFKDTGRVHRVYHCITADGSQFVEPAAWLGSKDASITAAQRMMADKNVVAYVCLDEGWFLDVAKAEVTPAEMAEIERHGTAVRPNERVEAVMFCAEDRTGFMMGLRDIIRPPRGKATLEPLHYFEGGGFSGRMVGLLPKKGSLH